MSRIALDALWPQRRARRRAPLGSALTRTLLWGLGLPALTALIALPGLMERFTGMRLARALADQSICLALPVFPIAAGLFLAGRFPGRSAFTRNRCVFAAVVGFAALYLIVRPTPDAAKPVLFMVGGGLLLASGVELLKGLGLRWMGLSLFGNVSTRWPRPDVPDWPVLFKVPAVVLWRAGTFLCLMLGYDVWKDTFTWLGDPAAVPRGLGGKGFLGFCVISLLSLYLTLSKTFPGWGLMRRTAYYAVLAYTFCMPAVLIDPDASAATAALLLAVPVALFPAFAEGMPDSPATKEKQ